MSDVTRAPDEQPKAAPPDRDEHDPERRERREPDPSEHEPEDWVAEDDAIIGRALRWSLAAVVGVGLVVAAVLLVRRGADELPEEQAIEAAAPEAVTGPAAPPEIRFIDITAEAGIDFVHTTGAYGDKLLPETMGGGVAFFDADRDGDQDLLLVNGAPWPFAAGRPSQIGSRGSRLYANDGSGRFRDVSEPTGLAAATEDLYGMGVAVADVDGDGSSDLFLTGVGGQRLLLGGDGRFTDATARSGLAASPEDWSTGAAFFDLDGDSDLDLFVAGYVRWSKEIDFEVDFRLTGVGRAYGPPQNYEGAFSRLYRNDGGVFTDVSEESGVLVTNPATGAAMGKALAVVPLDSDLDGDVDLFVANDTVRNFFFENQGDGTLSEQGELYGLAYDRSGSATGAMGVDAGYLQASDDLALLIGNFANEMTSLYVAQGDPTLFVDEAIVQGIGAPSRRALSFGVFLFDADLDGRLDVLQTNGHLEEQINQVDPSQSYRQSAQLFWNAGDASPRRFVLLDPESTGDLSEPLVGRGSSYADIDADGDLDVVITQVGGPPLLLRNDQQTGHHWLRVELAGPTSSALGARVLLRAGGVEQRRIVSRTRSYLSQSEPAVTFGLGEADTVDLLEITWLDGTSRVVDVERVDETLTVDAPVR